LSKKFIDFGTAIDDEIPGTTKVGIPEAFYEFYFFTSSSKINGSPNVVGGVIYD
jgi:hypothetical protein